MDIAFHPYELKPKKTPNALSGAGSRRGALLKIDGGYADLHPWPELGDLSIIEQLKRLAENRPTPQLNASIEFARLDAAARSAGVSVFKGLEIPPSHFLIVDVLDAGAGAEISTAGGAGFKSLKIKLGRDLEGEFKKLLELAPLIVGHGLKLRLDFNASLNQTRFENFLGLLPADLMDALDFCEDPFEYGGPSWSAVAREFKVRLAVDRKSQYDKSWEGAQTLVIKPALENTHALLELAANEMKRVVLTSNMDHPLGQMGAAFAAALAFKRHPLIVDDCGLLTHSLYGANPFSEAVQTEGPRLRAPEGAGFGFGELLEKLPWNKLR